MKSFSKKEAFVVGWQTFKERPFFLIGLFMLTAAVSTGTALFADSVDGGAGVALNIVDFAVQLVIGMGLMLVLIRVYDKAHTDYGDMFEPLHLFWKFLVMTLLVTIITTIGMALLIVPGIIAALALSFAPYLVVDRNLTALDAIKESVHITNGHRWNLLMFVALVFVANLIGAAALGIGLMITVPVTALAAVHVYRWLLHPRENDGITVSTSSKLFVSLGVVVVLLGLIVGIATLGNENSSTNASSTPAQRDALRQDHITTLQLAASLYHDIHDTYPESLELLVPDYVAELPLDPATHQGYIYTTYAQTDEFELCAVLETLEENGGVYCQYGVGLGAE